MPDSWTLSGKVLITCNCDWGCPCNFNARPTHGHCQGGWTWRVDHGSSGTVTLDGLCFSVFAKWPGAIHEGNGEALLLIDERADPRQRAAIEELLAGKIGGPWGVLGWTWPKMYGPHSTAYDLVLDGVNSRMKGGDFVEVACGPIRNPVTGAEAYPSVVLPEGIIVKRADLGSVTRFRVSGGVQYEHTGTYMAIGAFDYKWP